MWWVLLMYLTVSLTFLFYASLNFTWTTADLLAISSVALTWVVSESCGYYAEIWACQQAESICTALLIQSWEGTGRSDLHYSWFSLPFIWGTLSCNSVLWYGKQNQRPKFPKSWLPNTISNIGHQYPQDIKWRESDYTMGKDLSW